MTDHFDGKLLNNVHPDSWANPEPRSRYNMVVIGAGPAGLTVAAGAAALGAKVALVERHLMGGDCLNTGCVPSKAIIESARKIATVRETLDAGNNIHFEPDIPRILERMKRLRAAISAHDSAERFKALGVDVFFGDACFTGPDIIAVAEKELKFSRACIACGSVPSIPAIKGIDSIEYYTSDNFFFLDDLPLRLAILGGGPIGCEMAQACSYLGLKVTVLERSETLLEAVDEKARKLVEQSLIRSGVTVCLNSEVRELQKCNGAITIICASGEEVTVDGILIATGRKVETDKLQLTTAGVEVDDKHQITVNDYLQTTNKRIYAAGDVCSRLKFTHVADTAARIVIKNSLFWGRSKLSTSVIPWCIYTDPEVARTGLSENEAVEKGFEVESITVNMGSVDRAILAGREEGYLKLVIKKRSDVIIGATIVAPHAGELISQLTLAIQEKIGLKKLSDIIYPYPTLSGAIKQAADQYNRSRLTPGVKRLSSLLLQFRR